MALVRERTVPTERMALNIAFKLLCISDVHISPPYLLGATFHSSRLQQTGHFFCTRCFVEVSDNPVPTE
jgi:hypothetical protein